MYHRVVQLKYNLINQCHPIKFNKKKLEKVKQSVTEAVHRMVVAGIRECEK